MNNKRLCSVQQNTCNEKHTESRQTQSRDCVYMNLIRLNMLVYATVIY